MSRFWKTVLLAAVIVGGLWALVNRDKIDNPELLLNHISNQLKDLKDFSLANFLVLGDPPTDLGEPYIKEPAIRVAGFELNGFGGRKEDEQVLSLLADICRRFDVIALRGLGIEAEFWLARLAATIEAKVPGMEYFYITDADPSAGQESISAILFNASTVELDQLNWYTAQDPQQLMRRAPLVGWFRTRVANRDRAFTFTLVNAELKATLAEQELIHLRELFRSIRNDGRLEDDVILVGDFGHWNQAEARTERTFGLAWVIPNLPTDLLHTRQDQNIILNPMATTEYTGRSGVLDFLRGFNLRLEEAQQLSDQLPVWAEFSIYEGGPLEPFHP